jgi:hypothetical protein
MPTNRNGFNQKWNDLTTPSCANIAARLSLIQYIGNRVIPIGWNDTCRKNNVDDQGTDMVI